MSWIDFLVIKIGRYEIRGELLILIAIMSWIIITSTCFSCLKVKFGVEEGFEMIKNVVEHGADPMKKDAILYNPATPLLYKDLNVYPRTEASPADNLATSATIGSTIGAEYKPADGYKPIKFPADSMDILATTTFKPECCPSVYSGSGGCACLTDEQRTFFAQRGGSNYPIAEY